MNNTGSIYLDKPTGELKLSIMRFFEEASISVDWVDSQDKADVVIDFPEGKVECEPGTLHCGGRISCPDAFVNSGMMKIDRADMGKLLNHLDIRIFACQLGCFK